MAFKLNGPLVLAGAGKMGGAMLEGWLARGLNPRDVIVQDPAPSPEISALLVKHGVALKAAVTSLPRAPSVIVIAVKPQMLEQAFPQLAKIAAPSTLVLSIAAGRTIESFEKHLAIGTAVVRAMPNTPASIGQGITACVGNAHTGVDQRGLADALLSAIGEVVWLDAEAQMDAVTAVSGSGPAYVFLLAECLAEAGRAEGLDGPLAEQLARATIAGSGALLAHSELTATALRENVTSPGGTTAAALGVLMDEPGLKALLKKAVAMAAARSRELGKS